MSKRSKQREYDAKRRYDPHRIASRREQGRRYLIANRDRITKYQREWDANNRGKKRGYQRKYYATHRKQIKARRANGRPAMLAYLKKYRAAHREEFAARDAAYHRAHPEANRAAVRRYFKRHRRRIMARIKRWNAAHPENGRQRVMRYHARKKGAKVGDAKAIAAWIASWHRKPKVRCHWCHKYFPGKSCHADHVVPLSKGGAHVLKNLVKSCGDCNRRKSAKLPQKWRKEIKHGLVSRTR